MSRVRIVSIVGASSNICVGAVIRQWHTKRGRQKEKKNGALTAYAEPGKHIIYRKNACCPDTIRLFALQDSHIATGNLLRSYSTFTCYGTFAKVNNKKTQRTNKVLFVASQAHLGLLSTCRAVTAGARRCPHTTMVSSHCLIAPIENCDHAHRDVFSHSAGS